MEKLIADIIGSFDFFSVSEAALKLVLAIIFGGIIGLEREMKRRAAGLRTHMLVCLGAAMIVMTNDFIISVTGSGDPTRMAAQVVSGIGFLGAGTIIVTGSTHIRGLTTAAGMWAAAAVGLAVGAGYYSGAVIATILITAVLTILQRADRFFSRRSTYCDLYIELKPECRMSDFFDELRANRIVAVAFDKKQQPFTDTGELSFIVTLHSKEIHSDQFRERLTSFDCIRYAADIGIQ